MGGIRVPLIAPRRGASGSLFGVVIAPSSAVTRTFFSSGTWS
jgi:hypothetical protein